MGLGEFAALGAAFLWTIASMFWGQIRLTALGINLCKNWLGCALIAIHLFVLSRTSALPLINAPLSSWWYLGFSGVVGIVVRDTYFFRSLQILGPRRALILASTSPLFAVLLGWLVLRESLPLLALSGIVTTVFGVIVVVADRRARQESPGIAPGSLWMGTFCGVVGATCQAAGGVLSKLGMTRQIDGQVVSQCSALEATFIRLLIAAIGTLLVVLLQRELRNIAGRLRDRSTIMMLVAATACGTWIGIWFSQIAFKESPVAIAQTLHSTCPLFAIPLVWWLYAHKTTWYSVSGTVVALVGIYMTVRP